MIKKGALRNKLKEATLPYHRQIEANVFAKSILQGNAPLGMYVQWLIRFYGFYRPLEMLMIKSGLCLSGNMNLKEKFKVPLLYQDLKSLGQTDREISGYLICDNVPDITGIPSLLGYLYVVEGSTLGGQFIVKKLRIKYGFTGDEGCLFFNGYSDKTAGIWDEFCCFLNEYHFDEAQENAVIRSACDTFEKLSAWLNGGGIGERSSSRY